MEDQWAFAKGLSILFKIRNVRKYVSVANECISALQGWFENEVFENKEKEKDIFQALQAMREIARDFDPKKSPLSLEEEEEIRDMFSRFLKPSRSLRMFLEEKFGFPAKDNNFLDDDVYAGMLKEEQKIEIAKLEFQLKGRHTDNFEIDIRDMGKTSKEDLIRALECLKSAIEEFYRTQGYRKHRNVGKNRPLMFENGKIGDTVLILGPRPDSAIPDANVFNPYHAPFVVWVFNSGFR